VTPSSRCLVLASFLPLTACLGPRVLASRSVCHAAAEDTTLTGWCATQTPGVVQKCRVKVLEGDPVCPQELWPKAPAVPVEPSGGSGPTPVTPEPSRAP